MCPTTDAAAVTVILTALATISTGLASATAIYVVRQLKKGSGWGGPRSE